MDFTKSLIEVEHNTAGIECQPVDEVFMRAICSDRGMAIELSDFFTFEVPNAHFMPAVKARRWDGRVRLYQPLTGLLYRGLETHVQEFARERDYPFTSLIPNQVNEQVTPELTKAFVDSLLPSVRSQVITPYAEQYLAIYHGMRNQRSVLLSPTASGKSFIIYSLCQWFLRLLKNREKALVIVPTLGIIEQMFGDFRDYSFRNGFDVDKEVHKIFAGQDKDLGTARIAISSWQSLFKMPKGYFDQFKMVTVDECHGAKATSLTGILEKLTACPYRFGTTGTLDGMDANKLVIEGLLGPVFQVTRTKSLMEQKKIAQLSIKCLVLKYPSEDCKLFKKKVEYQKEVEFLINSQRRNQFVVNLASTLKKNTLILINQVEKHGDILYEDIQRKVGSSRKVFYIHGGVSATDRDHIRKAIEKMDDAILLATYGTFSVGANLKRLYNVVFAHPYKAKIRVLQSIGRGLRIETDKSEMQLFDIADDLRYNDTARSNYTLDHFLQRVGLYSEEGFDYVVIPIQI